MHIPSISGRGGTRRNWAIIGLFLRIQLSISGGTRACERELDIVVHRTHVCCAYALYSWSGGTKRTKLPSDNENCRSGQRQNTAIPWVLSHTPILRGRHLSTRPQESLAPLSSTSSRNREYIHIIHGCDIQGWFIYDSSEFSLKWERFFEFRIQIEFKYTVVWAHQWVRLCWMCEREPLTSSSINNADKINRALQCCGTAVLLKIRRK